MPSLQISDRLKLAKLTLVSLILISCSDGSDRAKTSQDSNSDATNVAWQNQSTKVDVATASLGDLTTTRQYRGTTQPQQEVAWRSQTEGTLLNLSVRVGDRVERGQVIGRLDDRLLATEVEGNQAELSALESELAQARIRVKNAEIQLEEAKIQLEQAKSDATRYQELAETGLIPDQQAESYQTAAKVAQKAVLTAQEAVRLEEQAVAVVQSRIASQKSAIAESQQRQTYSQIVAPISGIVTARNSEPGSLIRAGEQVVTIGDFSQIKITVPLSELDLDRVELGQQVEIKLDAFGDRSFTGRVNRIAPTTNPASRQIPIEIIIDNPEGQIKGGLLARVSFTSPENESVVIPAAAIIEEQGANYIFTLAQNGQENRGSVTKRKVVVGDRANGKVEITAGISPGERYVTRSSKPLEDEEEVGLSILSQ